MLKDQTQKKTRTLPFPDKSQSLAWKLATLNRNVSLLKSVPEIAAISCLYWKFASSLISPSYPSSERQGPGHRPSRFAETKAETCGRSTRQRRVINQKATGSRTPSQLRFVRHSSVSGGLTRKPKQQTATMPRCAQKLPQRTPSKAFTKSKLLAHRSQASRIRTVSEERTH